MTLPKNIRWKGVASEGGHPPVRRGDKVEVRLGYDDDLKPVFSGYAVSVSHQSPVAIKCEDEMFMLKQQRAPVLSYAGVRLKALLSDLLGGLPYEVAEDLDLGKYRTSGGTIANELQRLHERFLLSAYFRVIDGQNKLYVGLAYPTDHRETHIFKAGKNIISENFEYTVAEDVRVKIEATGMQAGRKKIYLERGDADGDVVKIRIDGISESELRKYADRAIERVKQTGFKGGFETFGAPFVKKTDIVAVTASDGRRGVCLVKKNTITFGAGGYRQHIELGRPAFINE